MCDKREPREEKNRQIDRRTRIIPESEEGVRMEQSQKRFSFRIFTERQKKNTHTNCERKKRKEKKKEK
jgi:hypothetical protein